MIYQPEYYLLTGLLFVWHLSRTEAFVHSIQFLDTVEYELVLVRMEIACKRKDLFSAGELGSS